MFKLSVTKSLFNSAYGLLLASLFCSGVARAQLPATNMGQFVHQPGDNQYTAQTQADRHPVYAPMPANMSASNNAAAAAPISIEYRPTPAKPRADISLLPIVADEPIKPSGFPPLPDRLDLPLNGSAIWPGNNGGPNRSAPVYDGQPVPTSAPGTHQHYVHYNAGAFIRPEDQQKSIYRPAASDYYNVNPAAKPVYQAEAAPGAAPIPTPATNALQHVGPDPQLAADGVTKPQAPDAVTVNQSVSQDLSLPEDDFNKHYPTSIGNSPGNRTASGIGRMLTYPLMNLGYTIPSMATGMATSSGMMMLMRH